MAAYIGAFIISGLIFFWNRAIGTFFLILCMFGVSYDVVAQSSEGLSHLVGKKSRVEEHFTPAPGGYHVRVENGSKYILRGAFVHCLSDYSDRAHDIYPGETYEGFLAMPGEGPFHRCKLDYRMDEVSLADMRAEKRRRDVVPMMAVPQEAAIVRADYRPGDPHRGEGADYPAGTPYPAPPAIPVLPLRPAPQRLGANDYPGLRIDAVYFRTFWSSRDNRKANTIVVTVQNRSLDPWVGQVGVRCRVRTPEGWTMIDWVAFLPGRVIQPREMDTASFDYRLRGVEPYREGECVLRNKRELVRARQY